MFFNCSLQSRKRPEIRVRRVHEDSLRAPAAMEVEEQGATKHSLRNRPRMAARRPRGAVPAILPWKSNLGFVRFRPVHPDPMASSRSYHHFWRSIRTKEAKRRHEIVLVLRND